MTCSTVRALPDKRKNVGQRAIFHYASKVHDEDCYASNRTGHPRSRQRWLDSRCKVPVDAMYKESCFTKPLWLWCLGVRAPQYQAGHDRNRFQTYDFLLNPKKVLRR